MSIEEFVKLIWYAFNVHTRCLKEEDLLLQYGWHKGWLEEQDLLDAKAPIERRRAARIVHQFLRLECGEKDEEDWKRVHELRDLYDCRTCVSHVAQVVTKGIMSVKYDGVSGRYIFGMKDFIDLEEAKEIARLMFNKEQRNSSMGELNVRTTNPKRLPFEKVKELMAIKKQSVLVDVRLPWEYEKKHLPQAINIPLARILENPNGMNDYREWSLFLYCEYGYKSEMAAACLKDAGFNEVYCFGQIEDQM